MSIRINSFGGPIVWIFRKYCSSITSRIMLKYVANKYSPNTRKYIDWFMRQEEAPLFRNVVIETINRCNGKCEFCPANTRDETRVLKKMSVDMFESIVSQLEKMKWSGKMFMCANNEPFIDKRILMFSRLAKEKIRDVQIVIITNGTLLSIEKMDEMAGIVDQLIINDYSKKYSLSETHKKIYRYVKNNHERFKGMRVTINRRYSKEILATRAGMAPNKPKKNVNITAPCIYPFTDFVIFPDGEVGMCCNDCKEITDYGNVNVQSIKEIWCNAKFHALRKSMWGGDRSFPFCRECDVLDAGEREEYIQEVISEM